MYKSSKMLRRSPSELPDKSTNKKSVSSCIEALINYKRNKCSSSIRSVKNESDIQIKPIDRSIDQLLAENIQDPPDRKHYFKKHYINCKTFKWLHRESGSAYNGHNKETRDTNLVESIKSIKANNKIANINSVKVTDNISNTINTDEASQVVNIVEPDKVGEVDNDVQTSKEEPVQRPNENTYDSYAMLVVEHTLWSCVKSFISSLLCRVKRPIPPEYQNVPIPPKYQNTHVLKQDVMLGVEHKLWSGVKISAFKNLIDDIPHDSNRVCSRIVERDYLVVHSFKDAMHKRLSKLTQEINRANSQQLFNYRTLSFEQIDMELQRKSQFHQSSTTNSS